MDLPAEFYLQTLETVFIDHLLPRGLMRHRGKRVDLKAIQRCALMTIEGENDDITGRGQTVAALDLTPNLSSAKKKHHLQAGVGHYGVFNGSRFQREIAPRIKAFMNRNAAVERVRPQRSSKHASARRGAVSSVVPSSSQRPGDLARP
jgi:poly(3-hydroxybutyrate) depolymerase